MLPVSVVAVAADVAVAAAAVAVDLHSARASSTRTPLCVP